MPTNWMHPSSEIDGLLLRNEFKIGFDLTEDFYGLMGGGITAFFDHYPEVFKQIQQITQVDFSTIMPLYHSSGNEDDYNWRDIFEVQKKFLEMHKKLSDNPEFYLSLHLPEDGVSRPNRSYFTNYNNGNIILDFLLRDTNSSQYDLLQKYYPNSNNEWSIGNFDYRFELPEGEEWHFGHDVCLVIAYIEIAISKGAKKFLLCGR